MPRALIIEDDKDLGAMVQEALEWACQLPSTLVGSAEEALAALAAEPDPDLLVVDVMLPGMSGWELYDRLRAEGHRGKTLFITASHEAYRRLVAGKVGDAALAKPFTIEELAREVGRLLGP